MADDIVEILQEMTGNSSGSDTPQENVTAPETTTETPIVTETVVTETPVIESQAELTEVADEPIVEPTAATQTPTFSFEEEFTKKFGKPVNEFEQEYQALQVSANNAKKYEADNFVKLYDLLQKGVPSETLVKFATLDVSKLDARAKVDLELELSHPTLSKEQRDAVIDKRYSLSPLAEDEDRLAGEAQMIMDAKSAEAKINELRGQALTPQVQTQEASQAELQQLEEQRVNAWNNDKKLAEIAKTETKLSVPLSYSAFGADNKVGNKKFEFNYKFTEQDTAEIAQYAKEMAINFNVQHNEAAYQELVQSAKNRYMIQNFGKIISSAVSTATSKLHEEYSRIYNSPRPSGGEQPINTNNGAKSRQEATIEQLMGGL